MRVCKVRAMCGWPASGELHRGSNGVGKAGPKSEDGGSHKRQMSWTLALTQTSDLDQNIPVPPARHAMEPSGVPLCPVRPRPATVQPRAALAA